VAEVPSKHPLMVVRAKEPYNAGPPLRMLRASVVTPVQLFFVRNHGTVPVIDPAAFRLVVTGLVERELRLTLAALRREFAPSTVPATIQCAGNRRRELDAVRAIEGEIPWDAEAVGTAQEARDLAAATGEKELAALNEKLRQLYQAGKPFREGGE